MGADPYSIPCPTCFVRMGERCKSLFLANAFDPLRIPHAGRIIAVTPRTPTERRCTCCGHERMECDCIACDCFATPTAEHEETP